MHRYCYCELIQRACLLSLMDTFSSYSPSKHYTCYNYLIFTEVGKQALQ